MNEDRPISQTAISKARTEDEIADFWDTHSLHDHWDQSLEAVFELRAYRRRRITLDPEVYDPRSRPKPASVDYYLRHWLISG